MTLSDLNRVLRPLKQRVTLLLQRAVVKLITYDGDVRIIQAKLPGGNVVADLEHLEPFGFTSHPKKDAEALVLAFGGNGSHSVALMVGDRRFRLKVEEGEVALFNAYNDKLHFKKDGVAEMKASTKVLIDSPDSELTGNLTVKGTATFEKTLAVTGNATFSAAASVGTTLAVTGASTLTGGASISGKDFKYHGHKYTDNGNAMVTGEVSE